MLGKPGKKVKLWNATRAKLKKRFEAAGITRCEICGGTFALGFAHSRKRRNITTQQGLEECAILCQEHHSDLERLKESEMCARITAIIAARETPV